MGTSSREALRIVRATIRKKCWERKFLVPIRGSAALRRRFSSNAITLCCCRKHELPFQGAIAISSGRTGQPGPSRFAGIRQLLEPEPKRLFVACRKGNRKRRRKNLPTKELGCHACGACCLA